MRRGAVRLPGLEATAVEVETGTTKYDLTIALEQSGDVLAGHLEYDVDLFEASTAERLATRFIHLLEGSHARRRRALGNSSCSTTQSGHGSRQSGTRTDVRIPSVVLLHFSPFRRPRVHGR